MKPFTCLTSLVMISTLSLGSLAETSDLKSHALINQLSSTHALANESELTSNESFNRSEFSFKCTHPQVKYQIPVAYTRYFRTDHVRKYGESDVVLADIYAKRALERRQERQKEQQEPVGQYNSILPFALLEQRVCKKLKKQEIPYEPPMPLI